MLATLSQNEISARAAKFANDWKNTEREEAEAQSFLIDFFRVAIFEHKVQYTDGGNGYIDLFWKGNILIEMKSRGKDLAKAYEQAKRYADSLPHHEFPCLDPAPPRKDVLSPQTQDKFSEEELLRCRGNGFAVSSSAVWAVFSVSFFRFPLSVKAMAQASVSLLTDARHSF